MRVFGTRVIDDESTPRTIPRVREPSFNRVSGLTYDGYFARWLLITAVLFAVSGGLYLLRGRTT